MSAKIIKQNELEDRLDLKEQVGLKDTYPSELVASSSKKIINQNEHQVYQGTKNILDEASRQASLIKEKARDLFKRVEEEVKKAKEDGFRQGREEGLSKVTTLLVRAGQEKEKMFATLEKDIIRLVYDIADKVIGREMIEREAAIIDLIREALHAASGQNIIILVHPSDLEVVRSHYSTLVQAMEASRVIQIRPNEKVSRHGCMIETEIGTIDAQLETQMKAIRKALDLDVEEANA